MTKHSIELKTEHGEPFEIPEGGSLGLLALGYIGIMLWREKRREIHLNRQLISTSDTLNT